MSNNTNDEDMTPEEQREHARRRQSLTMEQWQGMRPLGRWPIDTSQIARSYDPEDNENDREQR